MMIVTNSLRSCCGQATVGGNSSKAGRPLPASMAGGAGARPDQPVSRRVCYPFCRKHGRYRAMKRREFIAVLGGAAAGWPLASAAQQPKVPTIGVLVIGNTDPEEVWRVFRQGLRDFGYVEGQNIRFEFRSAEGQANRVPDLAVELVRLKVDVIVTWFTPTTQAAKQATREIPIVMPDTGDPIGTELVASLARPGGNITGIAGITAELSGKCIELIRDILPAACRVTALANATDPFSKPSLEQVQLAGKATATTINPVRISSR